MKILRNAKDLPWVKEITCRSCSSVLELEKADVEYINSASKFRWRCPVCDENHLVEKQAWEDLNPKFVKHFQESHGPFDR